MGGCDPIRPTCSTRSVDPDLPQAPASIPATYTEAGTEISFVGFSLTFSMTAVYVKLLFVRSFKPYLNVSYCDTADCKLR